MQDVFVSYATPDRDAAFRIAEFLEAQGIGCWIAPRDVPSGKDYGAAIIEAIETTRALVLVLSEASNDSGFVQKEVERAVSKTKPVLPVRIREVTPSGTLEFFISSAQWVDAWQSPMEQHLVKLADGIKAIDSDAPSPARSVPALPSPKKANRTGLLAGLAGGALLIAAAVIYVWTPWQAAWQRSAPDFLVGSWCRPMSGSAIVRTDFKRAGDDIVVGEVHFSHDPRVDRFRAQVRLTEDGFQLIWTEPRAYAEGGPTRYRVLDDVSIVIVLPPDDDRHVEMRRCPVDSGN